MKAQCLAIALLSSVAMSTAASASQTILSFEQIPGTTQIVDVVPGLRSYFAPVYVSGRTFNGALGEFELQINQEASGYDYGLAILGETGVGGNFNGITYLQAQWSEPVLLSEPNITGGLLSGTFSSVGLIEQGLMTGKSEAVFSLSPTVEGYISVSSAPEPSTWAIMLLGFASLAYAGYRKARVKQ